MNTFAERFKAATEKLGYKRQYIIAEALGISRAYLSELITGKKNPSDIILNLIEIRLAIRSEWLTDGRGDIFLTEEEWKNTNFYPIVEPFFITGPASKKTIKDKGKYPLKKDHARADRDDAMSEQKLKLNHYAGDFAFIPQVAGRINAGGGVLPDDAIEVKVAFRRDWIRRKGDSQNMVLIRVEGDSMEPALVSGDLVLIDRNRNYLSPEGGIYAIALNDAIMIKRVQVMYPSDKVRIISDNPKYQAIEVPGDQVKVNGKVIWFARELER